MMGRMMMIIEMVFLVFHTSVIFGKCISFWFSLLHSFENMRMCFVGVCFWTSVFLWSIAPPRPSQTIDINESVPTISVSSNITTFVLVDLIRHHIRLKKYTHLFGCVCVRVLVLTSSVYLSSTVSEDWYRREYSNGVGGGDLAITPVANRWPGYKYSHDLGTISATLP